MASAQIHVDVVIENTRGVDALLRCADLAQELQKSYPWIPEIEELLEEWKIVAESLTAMSHRG